MNNAHSQRSSSDDNKSRFQPKHLFHFWRCFWLTFLAVSLAAAWYCFYVPSNDVDWADNYSSAKQQAVGSGKPIILSFTGTWCTSCRIMKREVWADVEVMTVVNSQFIPVAIDVGDPNYAAVMARYSVSGAPVTIVTDPQGNVLDWRTGGVGKSEFLELLEGIRLPSISDI